MSICSNCTPNTEHSKKLGLKVRLYPIALIVSQSILDSTEKGERRHTEAIEGYNRVRHNIFPMKYEGHPCFVLLDLILQDSYRIIYFLIFHFHFLISNFKLKVKLNIRFFPPAPIVILSRPRFYCER